MIRFCTRGSHPCNNLTPRMTILTDFRYLHFSLKSKGISPKKLYSDFSYILAYLTLKYERNRIFHLCCDMFDFFGQALLSRWKLCGNYI